MIWEVVLGSKSIQGASWRCFAIDRIPVIKRSNGVCKWKGQFFLGVPKSIGRLFSRGSRASRACSATVPKHCRSSAESRAKWKSELGMKGWVPKCTGHRPVGPRDYSLAVNLGSILNHLDLQTETKRPLVLVKIIINIADAPKIDHSCPFAPSSEGCKANHTLHKLHLNLDFLFQHSKAPWIKMYCSFQALLPHFRSENLLLNFDFPGTWK